MGLKLLKNYLTDRQQFFHMQEHNYSLVNPKTGVPQGSILGPLFFLIYIKDIVNGSLTFVIIIYVDDTTLVANLIDFNNT